MEEDRPDSAASGDRGDLFVQPTPAGRSGGGEQVDDRQDGVQAGGGSSSAPETVYGMLAAAVMGLTAEELREDWDNSKEEKSVAIR